MRTLATLPWLTSQFVWEAYGVSFANGTVHFCQTYHSSVNTRQIFSTGEVSQSKEPQPLDCGALQDAALPGIVSQCGAHGGREAAHVPRFRVLRWNTRDILDAYRIVRSIYLPFLILAVS